jgi:ribosomal-protein-alanine N-acetyltransferase
MLNLNFTPFPLLSTDRLELRALDLTDKNEIFAIRSNFDMAKYLNRPVITTIEEAVEFIQKIRSGIENDKWIYWAICLKGTPALIGTICLWNISVDEGKGEVGFELLPDWQGKGIMFEALREVVKFGFETIGLKSIEGEVDPENEKSINLMKKMGFEKVTYLRETDAEEVKSGKTVVFELRIKNEE